MQYLDTYIVQVPSTIYLATFGIVQIAHGLSEKNYEVLMQGCINTLGGGVVSLFFSALRKARTASMELEQGLEGIVNNDAFI